MKPRTKRQRPSKKKIWNPFRRNDYDYGGDYDFGFFSWRRSAIRRDQKKVAVLPDMSLWERLALERVVGGIYDDSPALADDLYKIFVHREFTLQKNEHTKWRLDALNRFPTYLIRPITVGDEAASAIAVRSLLEKANEALGGENSLRDITEKIENEQKEKQRGNGDSDESNEDKNDERNDESGEGENDESGEGENDKDEKKSGSGNSNDEKDGGSDSEEKEEPSEAEKKLSEALQKAAQEAAKDASTAKQVSSILGNPASNSSLEKLKSAEVILSAINRNHMLSEINLNYSAVVGFLRDTIKRVQAGVIGIPKYSTSNLIEAREVVDILTPELLFVKHRKIETEVIDKSPRIKIDLFIDTSSSMRTTDVKIGDAVYQRGDVASVIAYKICTLGVVRKIFTCGGGIHQLRNAREILTLAYPCSTETYNGCIEQARSDKSIALIICDGVSDIAESSKNFKDVFWILVSQEPYPAIYDTWGVAGKVAAFVGGKFLTTKTMEELNNAYHNKQRRYR